MRRRPDEPELMGAHEAAETLGIWQTNLRKVSGLPKPYQKIRATTLWRAQEIRAFAWEKHQRSQAEANGSDNSTDTTEEEAAVG